MKKITVRITAVSLLFALLLLPAGAAGAGAVVYRNTQAVADNLSCTNTISWDAQTGRQESFTLSLTGAGDAYPIVLACDTIYGRLTAQQMIAYAESAGYSVLAAVNTDFFSMQTGVPLGIVVEDGTYKSSPEGHTAVSIGPDGKFTFTDAAEVTVTLQNNGGPADMTNAGKTTTLTHFNKYRTDPGGLYLFSSAFSSVSTRSESEGWYVRFKILEGTPSVSGTMTLEVAETLEAPPDAQPIGEGYLLLSAGTAANLIDEYNKFKVGDRVTLTTACSDPALASARWATGGGDVLIRNGAMTDPSAWDKAITAKNPRTAVGLKANGTVVTYVVDGHEADNSSGLTLRALAEELLALGCVAAVNLDGGGSSVISVRMPGSAACEVVNKPSDGTPRKVAAYLLFVTDAVPDGRAHHLGLLNDGFEVLAGSSVELGFCATDSGYMPVAAPGDIAVQSSLGTVSGATYTAGATHGVDTLTLTSPSTGAAGTATAHIIYDPTAVTVTREGSDKPVTALALELGETAQLSVTASYYNLPCTSTATPSSIPLRATSHD
jgi:exopolysaccharide biosynthesis protein